MNSDAGELVRHLRRNYPDAEYRSVYEAGFSGFEAHRELCRMGVMNLVINPADVPTSGRERNYKNDSIDSRKLARELENGSLIGIYIPERENLILRDLTRRKEQLTGNITRTKNRMIHSYLYFAGEERLRVIRSEHDCLKRLNRDTKRFKRKAQLNSYVGLARIWGKAVKMKR